MDLSEELENYKIVLLDCTAEDLEIQIAMFFDQQSILEYLSLYEMFMSAPYYLRFYEKQILSLNEKCLEAIGVAIRNADFSCFLPLLVHGHFLQNTPTMLESPPLQRILSERRGKFDSAVVVSAGPSLAKQLPLLKIYQTKAVIFCADGALSMLEKEGIEPDYVTNLDYRDLALKFFQGRENSFSLNLLACITHPNVVRFLDNKSVVLKEDPSYQRFNLHDFGYIDTGTHVSHFSYTLALALGFKNIIMIGQDLAFDKDGNSHSKGFDFGEQFSAEKKVPTLKTQAYGGKGEVLTHLTWNDYRVKLEYLFACHAKEAQFYNATEGGCRINFTEELSFKECCQKFLSKEKPKFELPKKLTKNRSDKLLLKFKEKIQKDKEKTQSFLDDALALKQILENILSKDFLLPLEFLEKVYQNIENFNQALDADEFIQDETLRGTFAFRGKLISDVLRLCIQDKAHFITAYIKAYYEWLCYFMEKLGQKYQSLQKI